MKIVVTGSSGHLGEALVRVLGAEHEVVGVDLLASPFTTARGSISEPRFVRDVVRGAAAVIHAATLHKPHVATHAKQAFVDTNVGGTLVLLEEAVRAGVQAFVFTSTTSTFGRALEPPPGAPAAWITEDVVPKPKNIYGVTKTAAEDLCELFHLEHGLPCVVLRTSRFFPEADDDEAARSAYDDANLKANEFLFRRADVADIVEAHRLALERASSIGFGRFIVSATTPFVPSDVTALRDDAASVVARYVPAYARVYEARRWRLPPVIGRVYDNARAREALGWRPAYDFARVVADLDAGRAVGSDLAREIGKKGYHRVSGA